MVDVLPLQTLAEFGIGFLLFVIGLNFSLPESHALRHWVLGLGKAQVMLTTAAVILIGLAARPARRRNAVRQPGAQSGPSAMACYCSARHRWRDDH